MLRQGRLLNVIVMGLRHYLVSGRVQGVGFRRFVEKQARFYRVSGCVRNLKDGRVEFLAQGEEEALRELEIAVNRGPMLSAVRALESRPLDPHWLHRWIESNPVPAKTVSAGGFAVDKDGAAPWA